MAKVGAVFEASVISMHLWIDAKEMQLTKSNDKWTGSLEIGDKKPKKVRLRITALKDTAWALVVKLDKKKIVEDEGTMAAQQYDHTWTIQGELIS